MRKMQILTGLTESHFSQMYQLEKAFYSEEYITPYQEAYRWYHKYPYTTFAAAEAGQIVGFINLFPIQKALFEAIKSGQYNDKDLTVSDIVNIEEGGESLLHMYLSCVVVRSEKRKQGVTELLLRTAVNYYQPYAERCAYIITDNVTQEGQRFSQRYGFEPLQASNHNSKLYIQEYASFERRVLIQK